LLTQWVLDLGLADPGPWATMVLTVSMFIGMFLGVVFTYCIHRIRVWRRRHNISSEMPSE
jgi:hypothetical protein